MDSAFVGLLDKLVFGVGGGHGVSDFLETIPNHLRDEAAPLLQEVLVFHCLPVLRQRVPVADGWPVRRRVAVV